MINCDFTRRFSQQCNLITIYFFKNTTYNTKCCVLFCFVLFCFFFSLFLLFWFCFFVCLFMFLRSACLNQSILSTESRPGKNRQNRKFLAGKFCELEGKIKKYIRETLPHWREIYPAGGKFCPPCREINIFFQACTESNTSLLQWSRRNCFILVYPEVVFKIRVQNFEVTFYYFIPIYAKTPKFQHKKFQSLTRRFTPKSRLTHSHNGTSETVQLL